MLKDYTSVRSALKDARQAAEGTKEFRESTKRVYEYIAEQERSSKRRLLDALSSERAPAVQDEAEDDETEDEAAEPHIGEKNDQSVDNPLHELANAAHKHLDPLLPFVKGRRCSRCNQRGHLKNTWLCPKRAMLQRERSRFEQNGKKWWGCYSSGGTSYCTVFISPSSMMSWKSTVPRRYEIKCCAFDTQSEALRFAFTGKVHKQ